ncbi:MAG: SGNH/GDSL hydrolase family protein [Erysipelotrichaceae bacterium]|nr:SGNH/GDSL hydrolase family protein [Erysipelotrichaceae bacterium]
MKKFLCKVAVYVVVVVSLTLLLNGIYMNKKASTNVYDYVPADIEICNLGSSHGEHGFYYKDLEDDYTCFNFALGAQMPSYDYRILYHYQDHLKPGGVVLIDISYFAPWGYPESESDSFASKNRRYYTILPPSLIKNFDLYTYVLDCMIPSLNAGMLNVWETLFSERQTLEEIPKSYPEVEDTVDRSTLEEDVRDSCERHIFTNKRNEDGELFLNEEEVQALYDIVAICRERNVMPVFVTVPYLKEYTDEIQRRDEDFLEQFSRWINTVADETGVAYFDYSRDERFMYDDSLFYNGDHLNSAGARKFTNILFEEVIQQRIGGSLRP